MYRQIYMKAYRGSLFFKSMVDSIGKKGPVRGVFLRICKSVNSFLHFRATGSECQQRSRIFSMHLCGCSITHRNIFKIHYVLLYKSPVSFVGSHISSRCYYKWASIICQSIIWPYGMGNKK